jgi:tRNA(Ile)-lysidine synthase
MLPLLEELGLDLRRLGTFAARMADADALIADETRKAWVALVREEGNFAELASAGYAALPRVVAVRLLGKVLRKIGGDRKPHALGALETLHEKLTRPGSLKAVTLHGCLIASDGERISVRAEGVRSGVAALIPN